MTTDHYADGTCSWWHLSQPPPELVAALGDGWLPRGGRVLDVGCGLGTETGYLASAGWQAAGIDLAGTALARAAAGHPEAAFLRADVRRLPLRPHCLDAAVDRGCFHYLPAADRPRYAGELRRVLRPGGKLQLRASLRAAGERNDIDEAVIAGTFGAWRVDGTERAEVPSDTRLLEVIVARLSVLGLCAIPGCGLGARPREYSPAPAVTALGSPNRRDVTTRRSGPSQGHIATVTSRTRDRPAGGSWGCWQRIRQQGPPGSASRQPAMPRPDRGTLL